MTNAVEENNQWQTMQQVSVGSAEILERKKIVAAKNTLIGKIIVMESTILKIISYVVYALSNIFFAIPLIYDYCHYPTDDEIEAELVKEKTAENVPASKKGEKKAEPEKPQPRGEQVVEDRQPETPLQEEVITTPSEEDAQVVSEENEQSNRIIVDLPRVENLHQGNRYTQIGAIHSFVGIASIVVAAFIIFDNVFTCYDDLHAANSSDIFGVCSIHTPRAFLHIQGLKQSLYR